MIINKQKPTQHGFTLIELILYVSIVTIMLSMLIPFAWNMIEGASKSSTQEEVSSNARYISERIKYEIRNASGVNNATNTCTTSISLANSNSSLNPTVITYINPNITIQQGTTGPLATPAPLNSADVKVTSFNCTNNTPATNITKNVSFSFTLQDAYASARQEFTNSMTIQSSAEVRSN